MVELLISKCSGRTGRHALGLGAVLAAALVALAAGCSQVREPEQADRGEEVDVDDLLHQHLQEAPMVTVTEAYRIMLLLADGEDKYTTFEERRDALEERGIARAAWGLERDACIDRGSVAFMVWRILGMHGGVDMMAFGSWGLGDRRYATRELMYRGLMNPGAPYQYLTGGELVFLAAAADRYMADHGMYEQQAVDLDDVLDAEVAPPPGLRGRDTLPQPPG